MFIAFLILYALPMYSTWFGYDSAIVAGQKGNWQNSKEQLKKELIDRSQSPELLYDAGVSCFKTREYDKALSYFKTVAEMASVPKQLHKHAWFNVGNSLVELQKYQEAIDAYDQVLRSDPGNERAEHNKEVVKKMLEEQKKEQDKKQDEQEKKKEQNEKQENKNHQQDKNDQKNEKKDDQSKDQNKDEQKDQEKSSDKKNNDQMKQKEKQEKEEQQKKSQAEKERKEKKEKESAGSGQEQKTNEQPGKQEQIPGMTPLIAQFLDEQEKKDAQQNKKMMKAMVAKHGGAVHGSNNW
jgi:tetratricopeptide (TPR) repeat protein